MAKSVYIGIDIGGTNTKFGLVNGTARILHKGSLRTTDFPEPGSLLILINDQLKSFYNEYTLVRVGIGAPNGNYYKGTIEHAPNLAWKGIVPLSSIATEIFKVPVVVSNDANAAAMGEKIYGAAKWMKDFIMLTLGTGVGSGIIANGQLILGYDGFAGELGHVTVIPGGRIHQDTGLKGTLESYASAGGIAQTAREFLAESKEDSLLRAIEINEIDSKKIYECALQGDKLSKKVYEFTGEILGIAIANFVMFSSPEAIILFGGVMNASDLLIPVIKENMEKNLLPVFRGHVKIIKSILNESDAAILGASALAHNKKAT